MDLLEGSYNGNYPPENVLESATPCSVSIKQHSGAPGGPGGADGLRLHKVLAQRSLGEFGV